jgi:hypothetical protein
MAPPAAAQQQICQDVGIDDDQGRPSRLEGRISWLNGVDSAALHLASMTLGEIEAAIANGSQAHRGHQKRGWLQPL